MLNNHLKIRKNPLDTKNRRGIQTKRKTNNEDFSIIYPRIPLALTTDALNIKIDVQNILMENKILQSNSSQENYTNSL